MTDSMIRMPNTVFFFVIYTSTPGLQETVSGDRAIIELGPSIQGIDFKGFQAQRKEIQK
jgi:hypothetical protein